MPSSLPLPCWKVGRVDVVTLHKALGKRTMWCRRRGQIHSLSPPPANAIANNICLLRRWRAKWRDEETVANKSTIRICVRLARMKSNIIMRNLYGQQGKRTRKFWLWVAKWAQGYVADRNKRRWKGERLTQFRWFHVAGKCVFDAFTWRVAVVMTTAVTIAVVLCKSRNYIHFLEGKIVIILRHMLNNSGNDVSKENDMRDEEEGSIYAFTSKNECWQERQTVNRTNSGSTLPVFE